AKANDRIVLLDQFYEERLVADGSDMSLPANITVESNAPGGKEAIWHLPANISDNAPLLTLANVQGLRIRGLVFDGEGRIDRLITLRGRCPGLTLENLRLQGFKRAAIGLVGCGGDADRPVVLQQLRTRAGNGAESALCLESLPGA